jgi:hypothetical protein
MTIVGGLDRQLTFDYLDQDTGEVTTGRIVPTDRLQLRAWLERFADSQQVAFALEGCTGWRYVVEELQRAGIAAHLAEPAETAGLRGPKRRAKTDRADARHLRELLLGGRVPESWIAPTQVLEARATIRLDKDLLDERIAWLQRVHATLFHQGVPVIAKLTTPEGAARLAAAELSAAVAVDCARSSGSRGRWPRCVRSLPTCRRGRWAAAPWARPTRGSGRSPRWRSGPSWATAAASVPLTTPSATPAWTSPWTPPTASAPRATWPAKGQPCCAGLV